MKTWQLVLVQVWVLCFAPVWSLALVFAPLALAPPNPAWSVFLLLVAPPIFVRTGGSFTPSAELAVSPACGDTLEIDPSEQRDSLEESEAGVMPSQELLAEMGRYNEELVKAGIMRDGDGLHPSSKGARVRFNGKERSVIDGPFAETMELVAGYWIWETGSLQEAIGQVAEAAGLPRAAWPRSG